VIGGGNNTNRTGENWLAIELDFIECRKNERRANPIASD
jgi:hypothetical protein